MGILAMRLIDLFTWQGALKRQALVSLLLIPGGEQMILLHLAYLFCPYLLYLSLSNYPGFIKSSVLNSDS